MRNISFLKKNKKYFVILKRKIKQKAERVVKTKEWGFRLLKYLLNSN